MRKDRFSVTAVCAGVLCLTVGLAALLIVLFGNPQQSKHIYMAQAGWLRRGEYRLLSPPREYTGRWVHWAEDGTKIAELTCRRGRLVDVCRFWLKGTDDDDYVVWEVPPGYTGKWEYWHVDGVKLATYHYVDGVLVECSGLLNGARGSSGDTSLENTAADEGTEPESR